MKLHILLPFSSPLEYAAGSSPLTQFTLVSASFSASARFARLYILWDQTSWKVPLLSACVVNNSIYNVKIESGVSPYVMKKTRSSSVQLYYDVQIIISMAPDLFLVLIRAHYSLCKCIRPKFFLNILRYIHDISDLTKDLNYN